MRRLGYFFLFLIMSLPMELVAQDVAFSQFYANPLYLAPSFAGASRHGDRLIINYRDQWPVVPHAFRTYGVSYDHYFYKARSGVGIYFMQDVAGSAFLRTTNLGFQYSFDFKFSDFWHMRPGVHFYYMQTGIDVSKMVPYGQLVNPDAGNNLALPVENMNSTVDFATSTVAYNENYWFGLNVSHIMRPNIYFYNLNYNKVLPIGQVLKYSLFGGMKVHLKNNLLKYDKESMTLTFLYEQQYNYKQLALGAYYHKNPLVYGLWYRGIPWIKGNSGHDALIFLIGYQVNDKISLGYSYDFTISNLGPASGGAHELSLVWHFVLKQKPKKPTALPCPEF